MTPVRSWLAVALIGAGAFAGAPAAASPVEAAPVETVALEAAPLDLASSRRIDAAVRSLLRRYRTPGAAIAVIQDGRLRYLKAYGLRDRARRLPVRTDTPFEIGSITKQFTAAAIVQLQERGKLGLDRPLADYLPDAPHAREVSLRQLLGHSSGLVDYFQGEEIEVDRLAAQPIAADRLLARVAGQPLRFEPGSRFAYSNTGYALLGQVIEKVSGERYRDYLQRHLWAPAGMRETFTTADEARLANVAAGYRKRDGRVEPAPRLHPDWSGAAGFMVSTLADLARWDAALSGGRIVSPAGYAAMTTAQRAPDGSELGYGLGLFVDSAYGQPRIGHTGGTQGSTTADEYFPAQRTRLIAFTNSGDKQPEAGEALTNAVFAELYPQLAAAALQPAPGEDTRARATIRAAFAELQAGHGYAHFSAKLQGKLAGEPGRKLRADLAGYGPPTAAVYRGSRAQADRSRWHDYRLAFGPGVLFELSMLIDADGAVTALKLG